MNESDMRIEDANDAESQYESNQRLTAFGAALGAIGMALQNLTAELLPHSWPLVSIALTVQIGWVVFAVGVLRNRKLGRTREGRAFIEQARTDERLVRLRAEAFMAGFGVMLGLQVFMILLATVGGDVLMEVLTIPVATSATIAAGVSGAVLRYQTLSSQ
jgi:hypothetical protein